MQRNIPVITLSILDQERFGVKTAKSRDFIWHDIPEMLSQCRQNYVQLLIARCPSSNLKTAQELERRGFLLMDTLVYYEHNLHLTNIIVPNEKITIRGILPGEAEDVRALAAESFKGYCGHYHADPKLDVHQCDDVYTSWAYNSCISKDFATEVFVAVLDDKIVGFATLRINDPKESEVVLNGVLPKTQRMGIYRMLIENSLIWSIRHCMKRMIISTQITNIAVQKVWVRVGFQPTSSFYIFHKWFN
ncbi:MAG: TDP-fucosamine acetyltransferase [Deltaproteobacteria bacterium ADurb.Bin151]|nr:MAG: TDP-fucosamine acetyltransferase [Deltaproteobacteria bacterium ADurb.Bin151]